MNTSCELISTQYLRRHAGDRNVGAEPKSRRAIAADMIASEHLPMVAVAGTHGRATVTRMIAHVADYMGIAVGLTSTSACGLEADVAVFMDADAFRSGQDAIDGASFTEAVREGGALILNADDPTLQSAFAGEGSRAGARVVFFSMGATCPTIDAHRAAGGLAYVVRDGWVVEVNGASERRVVRVTDMPATLGGAARFPIVNALAAVAAARAAGFGLAEVSCALKTFESSTHNVGRCESCYAATHARELARQEAPGARPGSLIL